MRALSLALARIALEIPQEINRAHKSYARALLRGEPCAPSPRAVRIAERFRQRFAVIREVA